MKIAISHIDKIEGHSGFLASIVEGDVKKAVLETQEGARLIEGILIGRRFWEAPLITSRICGICPVVHSLTVIRAIEEIFKIQLPEEITTLRKLLLAAQIIHSHTLHLFFLSLPDFFDIENDLKLVKKYPKETKAALSVRDWATKIVKVIGGRTVHPVSIRVGGFRKLPKKEDLNGLLRDSDKVLEDALILGKLFRSLDYSNFQRKTTYISLSSKTEYAFYQGDLRSSSEGILSKDIFLKRIKEIQRDYSVVKRVKLEGKPYMVGALARINNNHQKLNKEAKKLFNKTFKNPPVFNSFYNIPAQSIEVVHFIEESIILLKKFLRYKVVEKEVDFKVKAGKNYAFSEAPRGTLYHFYEINKDGRIANCNIITPTAQFLANLEEDLKVYLSGILNLSEEEQKRRIRALIRAYDPCITCSTH